MSLLLVALFTNMEEKLAAYRAKKVNEKEAEQSWSNRLKKYFSQQPKQTTENSTHSSQFAKTKGKPSQDVQAPFVFSNDEIRERKLKSEDDSSMCEEHSDLKIKNPVPSETNERWWLLFFLKSILWLCMWGIFIELQFGAVYFAFSLLIFIYFNTRTGKRDDKPSAYSVFNKDFERIQGTVTAEQLQQNMFRIPGVSS